MHIITESSKVVRHFLGRHIKDLVVPDIKVLEADWIGGEAFLLDGNHDACFGFALITNRVRFIV